ncbi:hypothetical protein GCM10022199_16630 [Marihabitans asiaticum]|uniref:Uncharacterized protein n=1 Tax=Marihabitans asiaticum TaxID=415218 RepID=A0A560W7Q7_9MICO|nr:hypothetical protein [Marihabitans asiaticum]TWD13654.1 hypothetical protein FB557_2282 [Marihabitans asiaticum]
MRQAARRKEVYLRYRPGHQIHWIQLGKARDRAPVVVLTVDSLRGRSLRALTSDGTPMNFANHDPARLARAVEALGDRPIQLLEHDVLVIGDEVFCVTQGSRLGQACRVTTSEWRLRRHHHHQLTLSSVQR